MINITLVNFHFLWRTSEAKTKQTSCLHYAYLMLHTAHGTLQITQSTSTAAHFPLQSLKMNNANWYTTIPMMKTRDLVSETKLHCRLVSQNNNALVHLDLLLYIVSAHTNTPVSVLWYHFASLGEIGSRLYYEEKNVREIVWGLVHNLGIGGSDIPGGDFLDFLGRFCNLKRKLKCFWHNLGGQTPPIK